MAENLGRYSEEMVRKFDASYAATISNALPPRAKDSVQPPLLTTMVRGLPVDISETSIRHFIYGLSHTQHINMVEYDNWMGIADNVVTWDHAVMFAALLVGESTITIWHFDRLVEWTKNVEVGLIQDYTNPVARVGVHQLQFLPWVLT
uniref:Integrase core domain containing protein n=1 Tax=Solanum tuberosum TaxID=4113 RepID=M1DRR2_SOLTU